MNTSVKVKYKATDIIFHIFNYSFFLIFTFACVFPFYYMFINTISANDLSATGQINFLPKDIHFENYIQIMQLPGLLRATYISVARTVIGTFATVMTSAFMGFMFTNEKMWGRVFWYRVTIATMYFSAGLIPWFLTMMRLGFLNNFWAYVIPGMVAPFFVVLVKTFIESTPKALQEAAEIDGAGTFSVFFRIILPISKPILATIAIFAAVGQWNSFMDTLFLMTDERLFPLQMILFRFLNQADALARLIRGGGAGEIGELMLSRMQTPTSVRMTISIVIVFPIILVYPMFQKYFTKGLMIGSIKG